MRVTVRHTTTFPDRQVEVEEVELTTGWSGSDQLADLCARAAELFGWSFGDSEDSETVTEP